MSDVLKLARLYWVLLALFTVGRWIMSLQHVPYDKGHHVFSIVTLTFMASVFFAAFARAWRGYGVKQAILLGLVLGLSAQVVIFLSTVVSYMAGIESYFNHPRALNVETAQTFAQAMTRRGPALIVGSIIQGIVAVIGWLLGGLLPRDSSAR
jgi:hypothetical protein